MPAKHLMSWEGHPQFRWVKQKNGTKFRVTCSELGLPSSKWTKDASYQAANDWWRAKQAELDKTDFGVSPEKEELLNSIDTMIEWAASNDPSELDSLRAKRKIIESSPVDQLVPLDQDVVDENVSIAKAFGIDVPLDTEPEIVRHLFGNRRINQDRLKRHVKVKNSETVGYALDTFLADLRSKQEPLTYDEICRCLLDIPETVWARETATSKIDEATVLTHYLWLGGLKLAWGSHNKKLGFFRRFVTWLHENRYIDVLPRNLKSKEHRRRQEHNEVKTFLGVQQFIQQLPTEKKTWAMLCLNCGMTAADLGKLFWVDGQLSLGDKLDVKGSEVIVQGLLDPANWTIKRRRSKTGKNPKTPTVTYKLWQETIALLESRNKSGLLFTTELGKPMYGTIFNENSQSKSKIVIKDLFGDYWRGQSIPFGKLRSIAADCLYNDKLFRQYKEYFLAHKPLFMSDRHYGKDKDQPFFEALDYIRSQLFTNAESNFNSVDHGPN